MTDANWVKDETSGIYVMKRQKKRNWWRKKTIEALLLAGHVLLISERAHSHCRDM